jgi:hypothetical protein
VNPFMTNVLQKQSSIILLSKKWFNDLM